MRCWAFDVDETLELSNGPVTLAMMKELQDAGDIVGVCGNMQVFCRVPDWHKRISFLGQGYIGKDYFLYGIKANAPADEYIMVGNIPGRVNSLGVTTNSDDIGAAQRAGWRFIAEDDFAKGVR